MPENVTQITTIDEVILKLNGIIDECKRRNSPMGYFAVLYKKVTAKVKEEIANDFFDDGARMEKLDVIFALRYINAYEQWATNKRVTHSWKTSFELAENDNITVLQHILSGINAHINLDLGIAANATMKGDSLPLLKNDFDRINELLSSMVSEVQHNLTTIWPPLKFILERTGTVDDLLVDFSMQIARDGAWEFANKLAVSADQDIENNIKIRDQKVASKIRLISPSRISLKILFSLIRNCETGSVRNKIEKLQESL